MIYVFYRCFYALCTKLPTLILGSAYQYALWGYDLLFLYPTLTANGQISNQSIDSDSCDYQEAIYLKNC